MKLLMGPRAFFALAMPLVALSAGCSVVNGFDEVVRAQGGAGGSGGSSSGGDAGSLEGGSGGTGGGDTGGSGGVAEAGAPDPVGPLVVAAGIADPYGDPRRVLSVIDAETGTELSREELGVAGIAHDSSADLWFLFVSDEFPAPRESPVDMQVRRWQDGAWSHVGSAPAIPPPQVERFAVLNQRLAYASWKIGPGNTPVRAMTVLDTSNPASITEISVPSEVITPEDLADPMVALLGTPGRPADREAIGGDLVLLLARECRGTAEPYTCALEAQPITVGTSISRGVARSLGIFTGRAAAAQAVSRDLIMVARPQETPLSVTLSQFNARTLDPVGTLVTSTSTTQDVSGAAYGDCLGAALFAEGAPGTTPGTSLFAVSLVNALGTRDPLGHAGEGTYYEPLTRTLFTPHRGAPGVPVADAGDAGPDAGIPPVPPELAAYRVASSGSSVSLSKRTSADYRPPENFWAQTLTVRVPRGFSCNE